MQLLIERLKLASDDLQNKPEINCQLSAGECLLIQGEMGCGKTTFFNTLLGLVPLQTGRIQFSGRDLDSFDDDSMLELRKAQGVIFDRPALLSNQTVEQNLLLCAHRFYPYESEQDNLDKLSELIREFKVSHLLALRPHQLSQGEANIIAIIRALFHNPSILIWDAALSGLDNVTAARMLQKLHALKHAGITLVLCTDQAASLKKIADKVLLLTKDKVVAYEAD